MLDDTKKQPRLFYDIGEVPETIILSERFLSQISSLDYLQNGFLFDRVTLIASSTDSGKSTFASQILKNAMIQGYNCFAFFGEDGGAEARDRLYRQYIPYDKENFEYIPYCQNGKKTCCGEFFLKHDKFVEANNFFNNKLYLFNNNLPADKIGILATFEEARIKHNCKIFLLDNVEMFDLDTENENKGVKEICVALRQYAITKKVHIIIISHIRKTERGVFRPNIFDVKGTNSLTNMAKNILTIIRTDKIDKSTKEYKLFKKVLELNNFDLEKCDAVIEVLKTKGRGLGFVGLKFNKITNTYYEINKINAENKSIEDKIVEKPILYKQAELIEIGDDDDENLPY